MVFPFLLAMLADERESRTFRPKESVFWESECVNMSDSDFKRHFRLERKTFDHVLREIEDAFPLEKKRGRLPVPIAKRLALMLWRLSSSQESYRAIGIRFGKNNDNFRLLKKKCFISNLT